MITIRRFFIILFFIVLTSCEKEEKKLDPQFPPIVLTPYHISATVDSEFVDAAYSYQDPDIFHSIYNTNNSFIYLQRSDTNGHYWGISGSHNLSLPNYPISFWPSGPVNVMSSGMTIRYGVMEGVYAPNVYDSTMFSITFLGFDHDTLTGTFQGKLFRTTHWPGFPDSVNVTNGQFKVLLNKI